MPLPPRFSVSAPNRLPFIPVMLLLGIATIGGAFAAGARSTGDSPFPVSDEQEIERETKAAMVSRPAHGLRLLTQTLHRRCREAKEGQIIVDEATARCLYRLSAQAERAEAGQTGIKPRAE